VTFGNCPDPTDFRESLDDPTIYEVSWVPGTGCSKKRASDSVLLLGSAQSTSDAQKDSLVAAQDSALKTSGVKKAEIIGGPANSQSSGSGHSSGRYPTWSAVFMIILIFIFVLAIAVLVYLIARKGGKRTERDGEYTKLEQ